MKKLYNPRVDTKTNDKLEVTKRLYRSITEIAKKLEDQKSRVLTPIDLYTPTSEALRSKLRDYCERLIVDDPANHVQKIEELLWRRGFYDVVSAAKKLRKANTWNDMEKALLSTHLSVGVGFYHHLILRLQLEYELELYGVIDFASPETHKASSHVEKSSVKIHSPEVKKCVVRFIHRSLVCLGDLERYKLDLNPLWDSQVATRYYKMAIAVDSKYGMPYNQLGTVTSNRNYGLDAVYHYMQSLLCPEPFDGAEGNLRRQIIVHSISGKEKCITQCCIARLLLLLQLWDNSDADVDQINLESEAFLVDFENCLNVERFEEIDHESAKIEDSIEKYLLHYKNEETKYLSDDMIFKIIVICLMKIFRMQMKEAKNVHGVIAFVLAMFSQLLQFVVIRLQESLLDISMEQKEFLLNSNQNGANEKNNRTLDIVPINGVKPESGKKNSSQDVNCSSTNGKSIVKPENANGKMKKPRNKSENLLKKLRRPRNRKNSSDSDASDAEASMVGSSSEDINSDISETDEGMMSDENVVSDDALSDDLSNDEEPPRNDEDQDSELMSKKKNELNSDEKFVEENEDETMSKDQETSFEKSNKAKGVFDTNKSSSNTLTYVAQKEKQNLDPEKVLKVLNDEKMLSSIKVCCDWLQGHQDIIRTCAKGSCTLLNRFVTLLNLISIDCESLLKQWNKNLEIFSCLEKAKEAVEIVPLPEDIDMKSLKIFEDAHQNIDWEILKRKKLTKCEETLLRALKIVKFGHFLCSVSESGITCNDQGLFVIMNQQTNSTKDIQTDNKTFELDPSKGKLMRHMGKLWLKAEVRALESRLHCRLMSPYLVPDHEVFSKFMPFLKNLVYAKKFIVVVPSVVISALDELKRTSSRAREATRWLETQLQRGSRFLRAQRPHEKLPLPLIKGPKPKDKEAWLYFQIIECCHYLTQQSNAGATEIPVVTFLTGVDDKKVVTHSPDGLAKSAGVNFEHIASFHAKWKLSIKSHG
ncbi:hypothetical protein QAD02_004760 [Eretmocerus hayati]|uniref:Uncharacterized protein n=1 Tax=Eretmocerus hayati TaxID=131215 RepID=A0ACC2NRK8_9HYME|nr:hypothetical protein QAD02_004760 [Eretmocerus hayati]